MFHESVEIVESLLGRWKIFRLHYMYEVQGRAELSHYKHLLTTKLKFVIPELCINYLLDRR